RTTADMRYQIRPMLLADQAQALVEELKTLVRQVLLAPPLSSYVARLIAAATPGDDQSPVPEVTQYFRYGPGPRRSQAVTLGAKVNALLDRRGNVRFEQLPAAPLPA